MSTLIITGTVVDAGGNMASASVTCTIEDTSPTRWPGLFVLLAGADQ